MKIDLGEIKRVVKEGRLKEVSQETGIPLRTLEDWRYENNKWLKQTEERLTALQKYINNLEGFNMKLLSKEDFKSVEAEYQDQVIALVEYLENNEYSEENLLGKLNELGFETEELYPQSQGGVEMVALTSTENVFREVDGDYEVLFANFKDGKCVGIYWGI